MDYQTGDVGWRPRFLRGDRDVIEDIYRNTFEQVRRTAGRVLRDVGDRDAVVHEVFADLMASRRLRESYAGGDLAAWIGAISRHRALDFARRQDRLVDLESAPDGKPAGGPLEDFRQDIERFAGTLQPDRERLLRLRFLEGMTQVEAAAAMGVPRSTLEDWETQLKLKLREYLLGTPGGPS